MTAIVYLPTTFEKISLDTIMINETMVESTSWVDWIQCLLKASCTRIERRDIDDFLELLAVSRIDRFISVEEFLNQYSEKMTTHV